MSSKKIYTTVGMDRELLTRLEDEALKERRTKSFILEGILRKHYELPWAGEEEKRDAN